MHQIEHFTVDSTVHFVNTYMYPQQIDLFCGYYQHFE